MMRMVVVLVVFGSKPHSNRDIFSLSSLFCFEIRVVKIIAAIDLG
jgi:hypothetical protein